MVAENKMAVELKELDSLMELFPETDNRITALFNSYLTFLTAIVGGLAIMSHKMFGYNGKWLFYSTMI